MTYFLNHFKKKYALPDVLPAFLLILSLSLGGLREFNEWMVFGAILLCVILFIREIPIKNLGLWAVFGAWLSVSVFFSKAPLNSFWQLSQYLLCFLFFCLASSAKKEPAIKIWTIFIFLFSFAGAISVFNHELARGGALILPKNPNYTAAFLSAASAALVLLIAHFRSVKARLSAAAPLIVFVAAMLLINSRGALVAFLMSSVLILAYYKRYRFLALSLLLMAMAAVFLPSDLISRFLKLSDPRAFERINIWRTAFEGIFTHPVWGQGLGGFEQLYSYLKLPVFDGVSYFGHSGRHAHSEILNIAATSGIFGGLVFLAAFMGSLKLKEDQSVYVNLARVFAITVFFQSCFDMVFYLGSVKLLFFGSLGLIATSDKMAKHGIVKGIIMFFLILFFFSAFYLRYKYNNDKARVFNSADLNIKERATREALKFNTREEILLYENIKTKLFLNKNYALMIAHARVAERFYPKSVEFKFIQAETYFKIQNYLKADEKIKQILFLEPNFIAARLMLADIHIINKNFRLAFAEVRHIGKILENTEDLKLTGYTKRLLNFNRGKYNKLKKQLSPLNSFGI